MKVTITAHEVFSGRDLKVTIPLNKENDYKEIWEIKDILQKEIENLKKKHQ